MGSLSSLLLAAADSSCQICQNGLSVPNPSLSPPEVGGATCAELSEEAQISPFYPCSTYHYFGALCGCEGQTPPEGACRLCQDDDGTGDSIADPDLVVDRLTGKTCGAAELEALYVSENSLGFSCSYYHMLGSKCGCRSNSVPPDNSCGTSLCDDGSPVPNPNDFVSVGRSCADVELEAFFNPYDQPCNRAKMVVDGRICGCDNDPPKDGSCGRLCGENAALPDPTQMVDDVWTCAEIEELSIWDTSGECSMYRIDAEICGCVGVERPEGSCGSLCEDGSELPDPDLVIFDTTCGEYEITAQHQVGNCDYVGFFGAKCGCNNAPPGNGCPALCGPDHALPDQDKIVWGQSCRDWELEALYDAYSRDEGICAEAYSEIAYLCGCSDVDLPDPGSSCGPLCTDGSDVPFLDRVVYNETCGYWAIESIFDQFAVEEDYCSDYHHIGDLCGCSHGPPENGCLMCDGPLAYPEKLSWNAEMEEDTMTCAEDELYLAYTYTNDEQECAASRSVLGSYCGCETAPAPDCVLCPDVNGLEIMNVPSPRFSYTDKYLGETSMDENFCLDVEFQLNAGLEGIMESTCGEVRAQIAAYCCAAASGASNNEMSESTHGAGNGNTIISGSQRLGAPFGVWFSTCCILSALFHYS